MDRRRFLSIFGAGAAAIAADPERLIWTPGKLISIPSPKRFVQRGVDLELTHLEFSRFPDGARFRRLYLEAATNLLSRPPEECSVSVIASQSFIGPSGVNRGSAYLIRLEDPPINGHPLFDVERLITNPEAFDPAHDAACSCTSRTPTYSRLDGALSDPEHPRSTRPCSKGAFRRNA